MPARLPRPIVPARPSRRDLIRLGGLGAIGLGLPRLLQAETTGSAQARSCIFIVLYGGMSHIDSLDPKPEAPEGIRGPYRPIRTQTTGLMLGELLPRLAAQSSRFTVIRSMTHGNPGHDGGMHVCMTGHSQPAENTPYFGAVTAKVRPSPTGVPSYVWLQNLAGDVQPRYLTGGFLGPAYAPLRVGNDLDNPSAANFRMTAFDTPKDLPGARVLDRLALLQSLQSAVPDDRFETYRARAAELITGSHVKRAFDLDHEPVNVRDRYGRHPLGQNLLMARRLIEAGTRLVSVTGWAGTPPGETFRNVQTWDMHGVGSGLSAIFSRGAFGLGWALPNLDQAVSALLEDLHDRGLLDDTLVVMVGEFGRTPKISTEGRDHWPACYSALLAGAGIRGGAIYGSSDRTGGYVHSDPVRPEDFGATLFQAFGIPPETRLSRDGFTLPASEGKPIELLFG